MSKKKKKNTADWKKKGFASPLEFEYSKQLKKLSKSTGAVIEYEAARIPYVLKRTYHPDFTCVTTDGRIFHIEVKGYFRPQDRVKMRACKDLANGSLDVRLLFAADNKLHAKSEMRYSDWCKKNGFLYAVGTIPEEWFR